MLVTEHVKATKLIGSFVLFPNLSECFDAEIPSRSIKKYHL